MAGSGIKITAWEGPNFVQKMEQAALDGIEEWADTVWLTQAREDCPVDTSTLRNNTQTERDDQNKCVYVGAGGAASGYALYVEMDRAKPHKVGKAGFIRDSVEMHKDQIPEFIKKHSK